MRRIWLQQMIRKSRQMIKQKYRDIPYSRRVYNLINKAKVFVVSSSCLMITYWLLYFTLFHIRKYFKLPFSSFLSILVLLQSIWSILIPLVHLGPFRFTMVHFSLLWLCFGRRGLCKQRSYFIGNYVIFLASCQWVFLSNYIVLMLLKSCIFFF